MDDTDPDTSSSLRGLLWDLTLVLVPAILLVGGLVLATGSISPFVTLTSDSMEPNIETGETVVVVETTDWVLFAPENITTAAEARSQSEPATSFGAEGDVISFEPASQNITIVHRVQFEVSEGERWVQHIEDDPQYETNYTCESAEYCPAPYDGYITAGDNNPTYDQLDGYQPVREEQINGVVRFRVPFV